MEFTRKTRMVSCIDELSFSYLEPVEEILGVIENRICDSDNRDMTSEDKTIMSLVIMARNHMEQAIEQTNEMSKALNSTE